MQLDSNITIASVVTCLEFNEEETIQALKNYAVERGYKFDEAYTCITIPHQAAGDPWRINLFARKDDTNEPLIKEGDNAA